MAAQSFQVLPHGQSVQQPANASNLTATFSVVGATSGQGYYLQMICSGQVTSCGSPLGQYYTASSPSFSVPVNYATTAPGTGRVGVWVYNCLGCSQSDSGWNSVTVLPAYQVAVTPKGITTPERIAGTSGYNAVFTVQNTGYYNDSYTLACRTSTNVTCTRLSLTTTTLGNGGSATDTAYYTAVSAGPGTLTLIASSGSGARDTGYYNIPVNSYGVSVTPKGATVTRLANTGGYADTFRVANTGSTPNTYSVTCSGSANVTCTGVSSASVMLNPQTSTIITARDSVGAVGNGTLALTATGTNARDSGSYNLSVVSALPGAPVVDVTSVNPGLATRRGVCLSIAMGAAAAAECGDLRIVHPLPTTRTLNKARTPTLLYNSQTAHPYPLVAANVTVPVTVVVPDSITGTVTINSAVRARGKWVGTEWAPGATRRVVLGFDGLGDATGIYSYTLEIRNWYPSPTASQPTTVNGSVLLVNRSASPFGAGWWLAGLEQLNVGTMVWVGGDGSVRQYQPVTGQTNAWVAPSLDHADTLKRDGSGNYIRYDRDSVRVKFDATGLHIATINRQGHTTTFAYSGGNLGSITLPPATAGKVYQFTYDANGKLQSVGGPGPDGVTLRATNMTVTSGQLIAVQDPDLTTVSFTYDPGFANRIITRTDRRGTVTSYGFDGGNKLVQASINMGGGQAPIVRSFTALESRGLSGSGTPSSLDTAIAYAKFSGPRNVGDTTLFWLDRFGAPRKVVDALGNATVLTRGDPRWPMVVTRVMYPTGQVIAAVYDPLRANVLSTTDSSLQWNCGGTCATTYGTTSYAWDPKWDEVQKIAHAMGDSLIFAYDAATGNRLWQEDGRGVVSQITFGYNTLNQVVSVTSPTTPPQRLRYDALGNLDSVTTPLGYLTTYQNDAVGRPTLMISPIDVTHVQVQQLVYDLADRDTLTVTAGPAMPNASQESVFVRKRYNPNGQLDSLSRWSRPDSRSVGTVTTRWKYDNANRVIAEIAPDFFPESTYYDPAGNDTLQVTRRGHRIPMAYDRLNRLTTRTLPPVSYPQRQSGIIPDSVLALPRVYASYQIPADAQTFTYDPMGRILTASNGDGRVKRTYTVSGLLQTDSLWIRAVQGTDFTQHVYGIANSYDANRRRRSLYPPTQLDSAGAPRGISFIYDTAFGAPKWIVQSAPSSNDLLGYKYSPRAEVDTVDFDSGFTGYSQVLQYDADGQVVTDTIWNTGGTTWPRVGTNPVRAITFAYDARNNLVQGSDGQGFMDTLSFSYSGLGHLVRSNLSERGAIPGCGTAQYTSAETFDYDGMGNRGHHTLVEGTNTPGCSTSANGPPGGSAYDPAGTGRLISDTASGGVGTYAYDSAGNVKFSQNLGAAQEQASFYAADGRLRATDTRHAITATPHVTGWWTRAFDEYRYDALGRRIWVRSRKSCWDAAMSMTPSAETECQTSIVRRVVWDQDEPLAEIQMPGDSTSRDIPYWESDTAAVILQRISVDNGTGDPSRYFGRVVYAPGLATDHPAFVTRYNYVYATDRAGAPVNPPTVVQRVRIIPFWNALGDAPLGVFTTGGQFYCTPQTSTTACVGVVWPYYFSAYDRQHGLVPDNWHGSLLEGARDKSGLQFKRNRFYDPQTGRFTQEDPLGLAGGLNLYGYANGDPVNYSDPFGLCPPKDDVPCRDVTSEEGRKILHSAAETGQWTWTEGKTEEGQIPKDVPNHVGDCTDFCETAQENAGLPALDPRPSTRDFARSSDFRPLGANEKPQMGDIVVHKGHAGVATGIVDKQGRPMGLQNGTTGTRVIPFDRAAKIYRRQVPDTQ